MLNCHHLLAVGQKPHINQQDSLQRVLEVVNAHGTSQKEFLGMAKNLHVSLDTS